MTKGRAPKAAEKRTLSLITTQEAGGGSQAAEATLCGDPSHGTPLKVNPRDGKCGVRMAGVNRGHVGGGRGQ